MLKVENENDIEVLEKTLRPTLLIARFMLDYIKSITGTCPDDKLSDYGAFFFL